MVHRESNLALMLPPELADGELHRQDLLAKARRAQRGEVARAAPVMPPTTALDWNAGHRAVAAAEELIRRHQLGDFR